MKLTALVIILLLVSISPVSASTNVSNKINVDSDGSGSSVNVNINNNVNTNSNSQVSSNTKTNVKIHQEGEGTSQVTVNGKEWKLEGPGDISVSESSNVTPTLAPSPTWGVLGTEDESEDEIEITPISPIPTINMDTVQISGEKSMSELIMKQLESIKDSLQAFFSNLAEMF